MPKPRNLAKVLPLDTPTLTADRLLTVQQVAAIIGSTPGTLNRARLTGDNYPPFVKVGASVRYKLSSLNKWIADQQEHSSTSEMHAAL